MTEARVNFVAANKDCASSGDQIIGLNHQYTCSFVDQLILRDTAAIFFGVSLTSIQLSCFLEIHFSYLYSHMPRHRLPLLHLAPYKPNSDICRSGLCFTADFLWFYKGFV